MNKTTDLRYEIKMLYDGLWLSQVQSWIHTHPSAFVTAYPPRQVNNIYFDTPGLDTLSDHLSGVEERRKLRLRWYGQDLAVVRGGVLELKQKLGRHGWKESMSLEPAFSMIGMTWPQIMSSLVSQLNETFREYLAVSQPVLINSYMREYYVSADETTRLTLDYELTVYDQHFSSRPNLRFRMPALNIVIIEVKSGVRDESYLADLLAKFPLRVQRYSKYVEAMGAILGC
jgi:hypothetical protein